MAIAQQAVIIKLVITDFVGLLHIPMVIALVVTITVTVVAVAGAAVVLVAVVDLYRINHHLKSL